MTQPIGHFQIDEIDGGLVWLRGYGTPLHCPDAHRILGKVLGGAADGWFARDPDGQLTYHVEKPEPFTAIEGTYWVSPGSSRVLPDIYCPELPRGHRARAILHVDGTAKC